MGRETLMVVDKPLAARVPPGEAPQAGVAVIQVDNVSKIYGGKTPVRAVDNASFVVCEGEFVSILGPSGCGKSTLLRIVAGLHDYESGEVKVAGRAVKGTSHEVGVVFQTSNLLPWLTVTDNMMLGATVRGADKDATALKVKSLIPTLGLSGFEKHFPHQLSGGMRQRAAIGQILALDPSILLMDEPFGALDALTRDKLNVELLRIWQEHRKSVLLITHSIQEAVFLSDRVLVMSERPGRILHDIRIDLPRPREPASIKADPRFGQYVAELSRIMGVV